MHTRSLGYQDFEYERKKEEKNIKKYLFLISKIEKICNVKHFFAHPRRRRHSSAKRWNRWAYFAKAHVIASQGSTKWSGLLTIFGKYIFKWASILIIRAYNAGFFYRHNLLAYYKGIHEPFKQLCS